jgi:transposase InsO family protein
MSDEHPIKALCLALAVSRSGYYAWTQAGDSAHAKRDLELRNKIAMVHQQSRQTYGSPRVTVELQAQGEAVGRHRVARLMRQAGLAGRQRRRYRIRTTDSCHRHPLAPNRLAKRAAPTRPNQVWVSDLTYVPTDEGWLYLAGVLDRYSRRLVGWAMGTTLATAVPLAALRMALQLRQPGPNLIHHSDRGVQYASGEYRSLLDAHGLVASMSRRGNCYDNAAMESFWSSLKNELVHRRHFTTHTEARTAIFDYIEVFYNRTRRHSALGYQSPLDFEAHLHHPIKSRV